MRRGWNLNKLRRVLWLFRVDNSSSVLMQRFQLHFTHVSCSRYKVEQFKHIEQELYCTSINIMRQTWKPLPWISIMRHFIHAYSHYSWIKHWLFILFMTHKCLFFFSFLLFFEFFYFITIFGIGYIWRRFTEHCCLSRLYMGFIFCTVLVIYCYRLHVNIITRDIEKHTPSTLLIQYI